MNSEKGAIFVTGGAGYIGSHAILELLKSGYEVVTVDNFSNSSPVASKLKSNDAGHSDMQKRNPEVLSSSEKVQVLNLIRKEKKSYAEVTEIYGKDNTLPESLKRVQKLAGKNMTFYQVDLLNKESLVNVFEKHRFSCVVHFAALKAVGESCRIPLDYYKNNVGGTVNLLEVMKQFGVKKFVFSSSATVYGVPVYLPLNEDHPVGSACTNPYGRTKYFIEEILKDVHNSEKGWKIILLRYFNPVGAHESGEIGEDPLGTPNNLMPYIAQVAVGRRKSLDVFGNDYNTPDGTGVRDYIHIVDLAEGHVAAVNKIIQDDFEGCKAYNLGTGEGYSVLQVIKAFEEASGINIPYTIVGRREGDVDSIYADAKLAAECLGWKAKRSLVQMCEDTWRWQSKNPSGFLGAFK